MNLVFDLAMRFKKVYEPYETRTELVGYIVLLLHWFIWLRIDRLKII